MIPDRKVPVYETEHFMLRQVKMKDAADLVECYAHPTLAVQGSAHGCIVGPGGYGSKNKKEMRAFIRFWLEAYHKHHAYVRWSVIDRQSGAVVGTIEGGGFGILSKDTNGIMLMIDLVAPYETEVFVSELLQLIIDKFYSLFNADILVIYGMPGADVRLNALAAAGFVPVDWEDEDRDNHYYRKAS